MASWAEEAGGLYSMKIMKNGRLAPGAGTNIVMLILIILLALVPAMNSNFMIFLFTRTFFYSLMAFGLTFILGWGGLSLMAVAFMYGIGCYSLAILQVKVGFTYWAAFGLSLLVILAISLVYTLTLLHAKGTAFMVITLIAAQSINMIGKQWVSLTGGTNGINGLELGSFFGIPLTSRTAKYYFFMAFAVLFYIFFKRMSYSPLALCLRGCRDEEKKVGSMGINKLAIRYVAIVIALFVSGIAGLLSVSYYTHVSADMISMSTAIMVLFMSMLGGAGRIEGALLGSVLYILIEDALSSWTDRYKMFIGILFIVIVLFMPNGIFGIRFGKKNRESSATAQKA